MNYEPSTLDYNIINYFYLAVSIFHHKTSFILKKVNVWKFYNFLDVAGKLFGF